jgi:hypothetical protein
MISPKGSIHEEHMTKTRAYTSEYGGQLVSAEAIGSIRRSQFNGEPTGARYFSTARPGLRRIVKHVMKAGSCFFAYVEGGGNTSVSDGESLNHILFKEALASLDLVKLRLSCLSAGKPQHWLEANIRIKRTDTEKAIERADGASLYADVYIEFEDDADLGIGVRWEGKLYIEVRHTHAVDAQKQVALRKLEVPVVEVAIPDIFAYNVPDDETTDDKERKHRQKVKSILEGENGFLSGVVLSDPCSKAFLRRQSRKLIDEDKEIRKKCADLTTDLSKTSDSLQAVLAKNDRLTDENSRLQQALSRSTGHQNKLDMEIRNLHGTISQFHKHRLWLFATSTLLALGLILVIIP